MNWFNQTKKTTGKQIRPANTTGKQIRPAAINSKEIEPWIAVFNENTGRFKIYAKNKSLRDIIKADTALGTKHLNYVEFAEYATEVKKMQNSIYFPSNLQTRLKNYRTI